MTRKIYERFTRSFRNPTKLSIMLLLAQKKNMTVTQMSGYIEVTKANLYHSIVELVKDGLVSEPEVQIRKSYIEKYYHLNALVFRAIDPFELQKRLNQDANSTEYKDLLEALFMSFSFYFKIYAHEISKASPEKLEQMIKAVKEENLLLAALSLDDDQYSYELKEMNDILKKSTVRKKRSGLKEPLGKSTIFGEENRIFVLAMPRSIEGLIS